MNIRNYDQLLRSFEGVDTIFHTAALHTATCRHSSRKNFYDINVNATENICKAAIESWCFTSGIYKYNSIVWIRKFWERQAVWIDEQTKPRT
ncbi:MAG: polysaccharide biosynthesis protein [Saprospiraceae bacterium]|nr:polysaccharide biosynthesis protein [Saprospiraceae bacterium]